jgi:hypothetical protein
MSNFKIRSKEPNPYKGDFKNLISKMEIPKSLDPELSSGPGSG